MPGSYLLFFHVNNGISYKRYTITCKFLLIAAVNKTIFFLCLQLQKFAYSLRNLVLKSPRKPLPTDNLQAKGIKEGKVCAPELLALFFQTLICGKIPFLKLQFLKQAFIKFC